MSSDAAAGASSTTSPGAAIRAAALTTVRITSSSLPGTDQNRHIRRVSGKCGVDDRGVHAEQHHPGQPVPHRRTRSSTAAPLSCPPAIHTTRG